MAQVTGPLPPTWETGTEFLALAFSPARPQPPWASGE